MKMSKEERYYWVADAGASLAYAILENVPGSKNLTKVEEDLRARAELLLKLSRYLGLEF